MSATDLRSWVYGMTGVSPKPSRCMLTHLSPPSSIIHRPLLPLLPRQDSFPLDRRCGEQAAGDGEGARAVGGALAGGGVGQLSVGVPSDVDQEFGWDSGVYPRWTSGGLPVKIDLID